MNTLWTVAARLPLAQSSDDSGFGFLLCCYGLVLLVYLALVVWVYNDASGRGVNNAGLWALLVFFTPIIGLIIYCLVGRDQGTRYPTEAASPSRGPEDNNTRRF